jgi:hypothetical protein
MYIVTGPRCTAGQGLIRHHGNLGTVHAAHSPLVLCFVPYHHLHIYGCHQCVKNLEPVDVSAAAGLLFNSAEVARVWIRVGGILFSLIGAQYLGTALLDRQGAGAAPPPASPPSHLPDAGLPDLSLSLCCCQG